ncbi:MAG TPA: mobile mystery protein B [Stellaceae bacterium]|nr:mobile mystery protein B [Stellaceae bacterium]
MSDVFQEPDDAATPLSEEEKQDLIPTHIAFRSELNTAEQENIARGQEWAFSRRRRQLLSEKFIRDLHKHMFGDVWRWAGRFRTSERNIGIECWKIPTALRELLDDVTVWIDKKVFPADEIAVRFHHRLVQIHLFPNGNGRHARLMADLLVVRLDGERFTWGGGSLGPPGEIRRRYIAALHAADRHDIGPLLAFARA